MVALCGRNAGGGAEKCQGEHCLLLCEIAGCPLIAAIGSRTLHRHSNVDFVAFADRHQRSAPVRRQIWFPLRRLLISLSKLHIGFPSAGMPRRGDEI